MKRTLFFLLFAAHAGVVISQSQEIDSRDDEAKVKTAVVHWADSIFYRHSDYKFENFHATYTDEYFFAVMSAEIWKNKLNDLENKKTEGLYTGTDDEFKAEKMKLAEKLEQSLASVETVEARAENYRIHFWTNIQTTDGITVYYEHILFLDNNYQVTSYEENSSVGKKDENTEILYKKDIVTTR